jgi:hypothetical protein
LKLKASLSQFKQQQSAIVQNGRIDFPGGRTVSVGLLDLKGIKRIAFELGEECKQVTAIHTETKKQIAEMESYNLKGT